jgi:hypothetical protein
MPSKASSRKWVGLIDFDELSPRDEVLTYRQGHFCRPETLQPTLGGSISSTGRPVFLE